MTFRPIEQADSNIERLIREQRAQLHGYVLAQVGNSSDAEDLVQQVCVILWKKRDQFDPKTNFLAWARKIARFEALNLWRKEKRRRTEPLMDEHLGQIVHERSEERELEFIRHRRALQACIQQLPKRQREVIESHYFNGESVAKIADATGMKPNAISQLLFRARTSLIACVQTRSAGVQFDEEFSQ
ncbi:MAG: sigma-70 family RNA polymerase sigma factor [Verrucomicrobiota bacterium]